MSGIDWSKAPEGATHYRPNMQCPWLRLKDVIPQYHDPECGWLNYGSQVAGLEHIRAALPRPVEWSGEGLPPVGTVCELLWCSASGRYVGVIILAHDEAGAVYRFTDGEKKGGYGSEHQRMIGEFCNFRPVRTPEQIAAEERNSTIRDIAETLRGLWSSEIEAAEFLYKAGYRKQEKQP